MRPGLQILNEHMTMRSSLEGILFIDALTSTCCTWSSPNQRVSILTDVHNTLAIAERTALWKKILGYKQYGIMAE